MEGFGVLLRSLSTPDFSRCFEEDVVGTAIEHIDRGLFEAHARDEAGFADAAGHDRMWFVARDLAFDHPSTTDMKARMLRRMGIDTSPRSASQVTQARQAAQKERLLPDDIDFVLETVVARMVGLLLIEISAFHGFAWAEAVLGDTDLVAGDGAAAQIVSFIRADETPHVAWLRTALSEMRDRTWVGDAGPDLSGDGDDRPHLGPCRGRLARRPASGQPALRHWTRSSMPWPAGPMAVTSWRKCFRWDRSCRRRRDRRPPRTFPPRPTEPPRRALSSCAPARRSAERSRT